MQTIEQALEKLSHSKFRSSFYLTKAERKYITDKGMDVIRSHAADFVRKKISPAYPLNDTRQTPMHGHPVFKAMHATAFCCRDCMLKWYKVPKGVELTEEQQGRIVRFLMAWIEREAKKYEQRNTLL